MNLTLDKCLADARVVKVDARPRMACAMVIPVLVDGLRCGFCIHVSRGEFAAPMPGDVVLDSLQEIARRLRLADEECTAVGQVAHVRKEVI